MYNNENEKTSILEQYHVKTIKIALIWAIIGIIVGFSVLNITNTIGNSKNISNNLLIIIDLFVVIPEIVIILLNYKQLIYEDKLNKRAFNQIKIISIIITFINYYILTICTDSKEVWISAFFLSVLQVLYLNMDSVVIINIGMIISTIIIYFIKTPGDISQYLFFQELIIRIILTVLTMLIITVSVYCSGKVLLNLKEEKQQWLADYFRNIEENQNQIREIKHNLKNQAIVLKSIINDRNFEEADRFINNMINETEDLSSIIYTENIVVNSILNYKISESRRFNIKWNIDIQLNKNLNINSEDLGTILGNLLDNAIEACYFVEDREKKIELNIYNRNNSLIIFIVNTKKHEKSSENTWKADKLNHGIGLKSVEKLIDKYNGAMNKEDKGNLYEVNIILWT